jgi:polar amino acid transport system permease protein
LDAVPTTLEVFFLSLVFAVPLALLAGLARASKVRVLRWPAGIYIEVFRGTSVLVQVFFVFYVLPLYGVTLSPLVAGVVALGANFGAYGGEVVRAGVLSVSRDQREGALVLGMGPLLVMRRVILPQAWSPMLPPAGNLLIDLLKATALVSLITLTDLTFAGQELIQTTGNVTGIWLTVLVIYFLLSLPLRGFVSLLERLTRIPQSERTP